jgi:hypothetical protein
MPCTNTNFSAVTVIPLPTPISSRRRTFVKKIIGAIDAFREAWEMRCAIRSRYPFDYE